MCWYHQDQFMSTGLEKGIYFIYIYMYITLLMRRLLTKNRIYTTFKRAMEREGLKQGWGEGEGPRPSPSYFIPLASPLPANI